MPLFEQTFFTGIKIEETFFWLQDYQKQNKVDQAEIGALNETNETLETSFNESQEKMKVSRLVHSLI